MRQQLQQVTDPGLVVKTFLGSPLQLFAAEQRHPRRQTKTLHLVDQQHQPGTIEKRQQIEAPGAPINQLHILRQWFSQQVIEHPWTGLIPRNQGIADADDPPHPMTPILIRLRTSPLR